MISPRHPSKLSRCLFFFLALLLTGCASLPGPFSATATATPSPTPTITPTATSTATPTPTLTPTPRTPPELPAVFIDRSLTPYGTPHTYVQDTCEYLHDKWASTNSAPGTVVLTIMFHSITNKTITSPDQISEYKFRQLMDALHEDGFQAITTAQLLGFLEWNASIPSRSVLLVVDDRKNPVYYDILFKKYWDEWGWPVVNAWISAYGGSDPYLAGNVNLEEAGRVDHQAHGYLHMPPMGPDSSGTYIQQELQRPIDIFQEYFKKKPIAIIWPGGGFTPQTAAAARSLGYQLGFTINPRGPVMFDWVPLADTEDPNRPNWLPEGPVNDPLMVLPRYWDTDAIIHLNEVVQLGQEAAAYAEQNKAIELEYYDIVCSAKLGPMP